MKFSKPSFCAIAPIECLSYVRDRPIHLALAHLAERSPTYRDFYRREAEQGAVIFLDNSCYEYKSPLAADRLIEIGHSIKATALVLPDYIFQHSSATIGAAVAYAEPIRKAGFKTLFVPQSERGDIEDWITAYVWGSESPLIDIIGISILGVPNAWDKIDPAFARVVAMQTLVDRGLFNPERHHHFLGLNSGPALEIPTLLRMGVLDTLDSSGPVWSAIQGHRYTVDADSYLTVRKPTLPVDFDLLPLRCATTQERIVHNLALTDQLFNGVGERPIWYAQE